MRIKKINIDENKILAEYKKISQLKGFQKEETNIDESNSTQVNSILINKTFNFYKQLFLTLINPFNLLLIFIIIFNLVKYFTNYEYLELASGIIVFIMLLLSSIIGVIQEYKSYTTSLELQKLVKRTVTIIPWDLVLTDNLTEQNVIDLVSQGKIIDSNLLKKHSLVYLATGDIIPADGRIIYAKNFMLNQSSLNGESDPVLKSTDSNINEIKTIFDLNNICFMGSVVVSGTALVVIENIGFNTYMGLINKELNATESVNSFNLGIKKITHIILIMILLMFPIILVLTGIRTGNWETALVFAVSIAVGLTPESLPMIIIANLTKGSKVLAKEKVVLKKLSAIQNLGAIDILCTDKTGTLTEDNIKLINYYDSSFKNYPLVLKYAYLNSYFQIGLKNYIDEAILTYKKSHVTNKLNQEYSIIDELPFDFYRKKVSVLLKKNKTDEKVLITKGAFENIIDGCQFYLNKDQKIVKLNANIRNDLLIKNKSLNEKGIRVVGISYRENIAVKTLTTTDETNEIFLGFLCFNDIIKKDAISTIKLLNKYGINVKILTGDNEEVTKYVCQQLCLDVNNILLGPDFEKYTDMELLAKVNQTTIFAKLTPFQKARVIGLLQANKHKVGFMGDGINDALALRKSDVAISVNNATAIAKEASDIILLEKSLMVLEKGILEGRKIFGNIIKYIKLTISANFGLMLSLIIGSAWLSFPAMAPIQILFQNLLYDLSQVAVIFDNVDQEFIKKPRSWNIKGVCSFTLWIGPSVTFISILNFIIMGVILSSIGLTANYNHNPLLISQFQTTMFTESAVLHMLLIFIMRTKKICFFFDLPPKELTISVLVILGFVFALPYIPALSSWLALTPPPAIWYAYLVGLMLIFIIMSLILRECYRKKFHTLL